MIRILCIFIIGFVLALAPVIYNFKYPDITMVQSLLKMVIPYIIGISLMIVSFILYYKKEKDSTL